MQVLVCQGETGCGKTTQLPQFILEEAIAAGRGPATSIVCTQPRRISAISVARRVAQERGEAVGQTVGYRTRVQEQTSARTKLLFCTSGALRLEAPSNSCMRSMHFCFLAQSVPLPCLGSTKYAMNRGVGASRGSTTPPLCLARSAPTALYCNPDRILRSTTMSSK